MIETIRNGQTLDGSLVQATVRIRPDQKNRLEAEQRARGGALADVLRDNLDLAFAMKEELSKIVEGEYDENDPRNAPRLVHTLLFRVEERILGALDNLTERLERQIVTKDLASKTNSPESNLKDDDISQTVENFISLVADKEEYPLAVWIGAFLEIVPRLGLVGLEQLNELQYKGETWLEEHGYYSSSDQGSALNEQPGFVYQKP